jgi:hypothetical protein
MPKNSRENGVWSQRLGFNQHQWRTLGFSSFHGGLSNKNIWRTKSLGRQMRQMGKNGGVHPQNKSIPATKPATWAAIRNHGLWGSWCQIRWNHSQLAAPRQLFQEFGRCVVFDSSCKFTVDINPYKTKLLEL